MWSNRTRSPKLQGFILDLIKKNFWFCLSFIGRRVKLELKQINFFFKIIYNKMFWVNSSITKYAYGFHYNILRKGDIFKEIQEVWKIK